MILYYTNQMSQLFCNMQQRATKIFEIETDITSVTGKKKR